MPTHISKQTLHLGAYNGATEVPLAYFPSGLGGITILEAWLIGPSAGTAIGGKLVTMGAVATGGTPAIDGTVGAFAGTIITGAGIAHKLTVSTAYVSAGEFLGWDQTSGTVPAGTFIDVTYTMGK